MSGTHDAFAVGVIVGRILVFIVAVALANWAMRTLRARPPDLRKKRWAVGTLVLALSGIIEGLIAFAMRLSHSLNP
jgi:hypothetical protein